MKFTPEQKQELVSRYHNGESATDICTQAGISRSTFYTWLKPHQTTVTGAGHVVNAAEFVKMKKKLEKLEQKLEVLQKVNCMSLKHYRVNIVSTFSVRHSRWIGVPFIIICFATKRIKAVISFVELNSANKLY